MSDVDTVDKLVVFLGKRAGTDKLIKTIQYASKLAHWHLEKTHPEAARRAKLWETAAGLSRKAYRSGQFLAGFNEMRRNPGRTPALRILSVLGNSGMMVYYFFDHLLWLSRIGVIDPKLADKFSFISASGEAFWYVFTLVSGSMMIMEGIRQERKIREFGTEADREMIKKIRVDRVMILMGMAADLGDLLIAIGEIEPNPFCDHVVTRVVCGLVSAWAGWYRNWPSS